MENWVRGDVFQQVLGYVKKKRGNAGLAVLTGAKTYNTEQTYPFEEFCKILLSAEETLGCDAEDGIVHLARESMVDDSRWRLLFSRMKPMDIFTSKQRQEGRHQVGKTTPEKTGDKEVVILMELTEGPAAHKDAWSRFYQGRLEGILKLTGREGTVTRVKMGVEGSYAFTVTWD